MLQAVNATFEIAGKALVKEASLQLLPGQMCAVIGPNGAGKSTLFKMLTGELKPTRGEIRIDGSALASQPPVQLASRRAVVPQASRLSFPFTVAEVVLLGASVPGLSEAGAAQHEAAQTALETTGLSHLADRFYTRLSGGERQRVHLARALCQLICGRRYTSAAPILMLDEPTSSLDLMHQIKVLAHVQELARSGHVVLVVLHDLNLAAAFADQLVVMSDGEIVASGRTADVFTSDTLSSVYRCPIAINTTPEPDAAFVLPHYTIKATTPQQKQRV
ncbi:MAG: heme ABC transporter ATP-binding protein [Pseudomonadota bacterium]